MKTKIFKGLIIISILFFIGINMFHQQTREIFKDSVCTFLNFGNTHNEIINKGSEDKKMIALTFDDGPHPRFTPKILDLLKEYDAKATFFVIGKHVEAYPEVLKIVAKEGHEIGNHTFSHIDTKQTSSIKVEEELKKTQEIIFNTTGIKSKVFRPPFGFYNSQIIDIAHKYDCKIVLWSPHQDAKDWNYPGVDNIVHQVLSKVQNGDIILLHDYVEKDCQSIEALKTILPELKSRGYKFVTISELIKNL
ncbi:polysaccharide deacetylase family protein [Anaerophilus nitritogenes]|uniref:polysaccharide deacetylase family protein n=1 Tax=Anaerophilus nitritogenes TaxID=2498136 RepID=UPI001930E882|nr:polysaccharide deacetylase family protein [Anaerophilus nitritogenes]